MKWDSVAILAALFASHWGDARVGSGFPWRVFSFPLPNHAARMVGGLAALPCWEFLKYIRPSQGAYRRDQYPGAGASTGPRSSEQVCDRVLVSQQFPSSLTKIRRASERNPRSCAPEIAARRQHFTHQGRADRSSCATLRAGARHLPVAGPGVALASVGSGESGGRARSGKPATGPRGMRYKALSLAQS